MVRSALGKVAWVGRTASMVFGLALVLALLFGVATTALGANGGTFVLGKLNNAATRVTGLVGNVDGAAALRVTNPNAGTNDTALDLRVQAGEAPMKVNSATRVANLNADQLDGKSDTDFYAAGSRVDASWHAYDADNATTAINAGNADKVDQLDSTALLPGGDLPRGRTVRGSYAATGLADPSTSGLSDTTISFGYRLASTPTVRIIKAGTTPPAECPGTPASPEADPGYLCIYEKLSDSVHTADPTLFNQTRNGVSLYAWSVPNSGTEPKSFIMYGTWAVTGN